MILKTKLFGHVYEFKSICEVMAKANEEKSGDRLAGLAAESAEERVAAKVVLSNLTLVLAIKHIGSTMTSILGSMEPLTAVLVGVVHFGEGFDLDSAAGLILVVTAVIIVILQTNHTPQTPPANIPPTQPQE